MSSPPIQWYPGHIAKAERALAEQLKKVDVVFEVRDARIPLATCHPQMQQWVGSKERVLILNRVDMIPVAAKDEWTDWFRARGEQPIFTNANAGQGITLVVQAAKVVGDRLNRRRRDRGMLPRPVRAVVIGFPNVGKSALINRLLKKRVVESARRPGVTRSLRWVRISDQIELLDAPGILPSKLEDQMAATRLAICDDIGEAAYDNERIAAALVDIIQTVVVNAKEMISGDVLAARYGVESDRLTGESYLQQLADEKHHGEKEKAARQILTDFRKGMLGAIPLELPE
jgi:ribosome biogenesis GTPase A